MDHEVRIDPSSHLTLVHFTGGLDLEELFATIQTLHKERDPHPYHRTIWDAQALRELVLSPGDLHRLFNRLAHQRDLSEKALEVIVVQRPLDFNVAQLYSALAERHGYEVQVVWSMKQALAYLELEALPEALRQPVLDGDPPQAKAS